MKEAFEKIVEKLEELKKAEIERDDLCDEEGCGDGEEIYEDGKSQGRFEQVVRIIEIVKQEAEKYNNGWIPCSERLPEEAFGCLVTVMDCNPSTQTDFENILPYFVGYDGDSWNDADGEEIPFEVLAWRKLPLPYQPKGE